MERIKNVLAPRKCRNIVEACVLINTLRKGLGVAVFHIKSSDGNIISSSFTYVGCVFFVIWHSIYFFALYNVYSYDQSILRLIFDTKLNHYGDLVENIATTTYVVYAMWKIAFDLSAGTKHMQEVVDIDQEIISLGDNIDYKRNSMKTYLIPICESTIWTFRLLSVWFSIKKTVKQIPYSKIFQVVFSDSIAFTTIVHYCVYLYVIRDRYRRVNRVLRELQTRVHDDFFIVRIKKPDYINATRMQDRLICEKINTCGKIYSMLYKATETANNKFGFALLLTLFVWLVLIILYLYYFMEATAAGLFHDVDCYINFLIFVFWQIIFSIAVMSSGIYFCETTVKEAKSTSFIAHTMINSNLDLSIKEKAINISLQVIHQTPKFTARGLFPIEYMLLLEGARSIVTFLIILLQFATENNR